MTKKSSKSSYFRSWNQQKFDILHEKLLKRLISHRNSWKFPFDQIIHESTHSCSINANSVVECGSVT